jgi:cytochrome P450 family 313
MESFGKSESWTKEDLLSDFIILFFGSFDTSGSTIGHILLLLAMNPECQEKLYEELKSVLKSQDDAVNEDKINQLSYLNLVIKEGMRLIPAVLILSRQVTNPLKLGEKLKWNLVAKNIHFDVIAENYTLPTDTNVSIWVLELHTDKKIWGENARQFKPERFRDENISKIHPYAYIPFSNGPRICIGYKYALMSTKIFLAQFLMRYRVTTTLKYEDLNYVFGVTMKIKQDLIVNIEKRR